MLFGTPVSQTIAGAKTLAIHVATLGIHGFNCGLLGFAEAPAKPKKPGCGFLTFMLQCLQAELSVPWLLFLGMFLVVVSSGVLAASQWERFPGFLQYGI